MLPTCAVCAEPIFELVNAREGLCLICAHRTTPAERRSRRPEAGVIDSA